MYELSIFKVLSHNDSIEIVPMYVVYVDLVLLNILNTEKSSF